MTCDLIGDMMEAFCTGKDHLFDWRWSNEFTFHLNKCYLEINYGRNRMKKESNRMCMGR